MTALDRTAAGMQCVLPGAERSETGRAQRAADKPAHGTFRCSRAIPACSRTTPHSLTCSTCFRPALKRVGRSRQPPARVTVAQRGQQGHRGARGNRRLLAAVAVWI
jgi:hypothetical protein